MPTRTNTATPTALSTRIPSDPIRSAFRLARNGSTLSIPLFTSKDIATPDAQIQRAVIVIHGSSLNADDYWRYAAEAVQGVDNLVLIAPLFAESPATSDQLYWTTKWRDGDPSVGSGRPWQISSFEVMDEILGTLTASYPNLTTITIAGHSGGAQFAHRYAATRVDSRIQYLVSAPSTYLYMDAIRPGPTCQWYNEYKYGLDDLDDTPYMEAIGAVTLKANYRQARVAYIVGGADNDPNEATLGTNCQALAQGAHRVERAEEYYASLARIYGTSIYANQSFAIVPGIGHEGRQMLNSEPARALLRR